MKDIPKVFVNPIEDDIHNSLDRVVLNKDKYVDLSDILKKDTYSFNHTYLIRLKDNKEIKSSIIKKTDTRILTIDGDWIYINDILNITEIKK